MDTSEPLKPHPRPLQAITTNQPATPVVHPLSCAVGVGRGIEEVGRGGRLGNVAQSWASIRSDNSSHVASNGPVRSGNKLLDDDEMETDVQNEGNPEVNSGAPGAWPRERVFSSSFSGMDEDDLEKPECPVSRKGFLALKDQKPKGFSLALTANKRQKFSAPAFSGLAGGGDGGSRGQGFGGGGGGNDGGGGDGGSRGQDFGGGGGGNGGGGSGYQSLREENREHLKHDREVQERCQAAAAAKKFAKNASPLGNVVLRQAGGIMFPKASAADVSGPPAARQMNIPDVLPSPQAYKTTFVDALEEEINIRLQDSAVRLYQALRELTGARKGTLVQCKCKPPKAPSVATVRKEGANQNRPFFSCRSCNFFQWADAPVKSGGGSSQSLAHEAKVIDMTNPPNLAILRQRQVPVYACQVISTDRKDFQQINARKKAGHVDAGTKRETRTCIKMPEQLNGKVPGCHKDDIWIISSSPFFSADPSATTVIATSTWYGADGDNNIELKPLVGQLSLLKNRNVVYALKGPNITSELDMLETLKDFSPREVPLIPALLTGATRVSHSVSQALPLRKMAPTSIDINEEEMQMLVQENSEKYSLNQEQTQVLEEIARSILRPEASSPVVLIQGVFGSGKSTLLVAVVLFLLEVFKKAGVQEGAPEGRILISAATNVAVDNILIGLLSKGYQEFIRIGSLPRIAKVEILKSKLYSGFVGKGTSEN